MNASERQLDAIGELMNIGVGRAAGMLNQMLGSPIRLTVPRVKILRASELPAELDRQADESLSLVRLTFRGALEGTAALVFPPDSAAKLVAALTGEEPGAPDLDSVRSGTLSEVGNIVINGVMGSIGNILDVRLSYGLPAYLEAPVDSLFGRHAASDAMVVVAQTRFRVEDLAIAGTVLLVFKVLSFDMLLAAVDAAGEGSA